MPATVLQVPRLDNKTQIRHDSVLQHSKEQEHRPGNFASIGWDQTDEIDTCTCIVSEELRAKGLRISQKAVNKLVPPQHPFLS